MEAVNGTVIRLAIDPTALAVAFVGSTTYRVIAAFEPRVAVKKAKCFPIDVTAEDPITASEPATLRHVTRETRPVNPSVLTASLRTILSSSVAAGATNPLNI